MKSLIIYLFSVSFAICLCGCINNSHQTENLQTVRFGTLPYGDHSFVVIGAKKGWFKDVGINLEYQPVSVDAITSLLNNGSKDVISCPPGILFSSYEKAPGLCTFVFSDLFQGYAILAKTGKYKSVEQFMTSGQDFKQAVISTVQQIKGRKFTYPSETAIKPFIDLVLSQGKLKKSAFTSLVVDDPLTVNEMRSGQAEFQVGGVPSRIVLQKEGYFPIISSISFAKSAVPSDTSQALASILQNGWATTKKYYTEHHDLILKMASVNYRIMKYINQYPDSAAEIHMSYLSSITGQSFTSKDAMVIYKDLDPFYTFEAQSQWFHDKNSPLYYRYVNGSILNNFISQKIYKSTPPRVNDVIKADQVYYELEKLKADCDNINARLSVPSNKADHDIFEKAKFYYSIYDFSDAKKYFEILERK